MRLTLGQFICLCGSTSRRYLIMALITFCVDGSNFSSKPNKQNGKQTRADNEQIHLQSCCSGATVRLMALQPAQQQQQQRHGTSRNKLSQMINYLQQKKCFKCVQHKCKYVYGLLLTTHYLHAT